MIRRLLRGLRARLRDEAGTATVEFCIVFPVFMLVLCSMAETGTLMMRQVMLDRGVDIAVRDLRINTWPTVTQDLLRTRICDSVIALSDCKTSLVVEMTQIAKGASLPSAAAPCVDRAASVTPSVTFVQGKENQMMLVRACATFRPILPGVGLGLDLAKDRNGYYALTATSAFVVEPQG